jgi:queuosine precursor transporter
MVEMLSIRASFLLMIAVVTAANFLVQYPINEWLTWGAFPYPVSFLITELTNRQHGSKVARQVVYSGFLAGMILSMWLSTPKIAFASGIAFLISQLLDIYVFNQLRRNVTWWVAPLFASIIASFIDSMLFWNLAFFGEKAPIFTWGVGDTLMKIFIDSAMLMPFRLMTRPQPTVIKA